MFYRLKCDVQFFSEDGKQGIIWEDMRVNLNHISAYFSVRAADLLGQKYVKKGAENQPLSILHMQNGDVFVCQKSADQIDDILQQTDDQRFQTLSHYVTTLREKKA